MIIVFVTFAVAGLLIVLGFVALLAQKTYLDRATQAPVELELPVLGKLKANYPALIFVFLGFALAYFAFQKGFPPRKIEWRLEGAFTHPENRKIAWTTGELVLAPNETQVKVFDQGAFQVTALIEEGKSIEDVFETLIFSHPSGSMQIDLKKEVNDHRGGKPSLLARLTDHTRVFKPVPIELFPQTDP